MFRADRDDNGVTLVDVRKEIAEYFRFAFELTMEWTKYTRSDLMSMHEVDFFKAFQVAKERQEDRVKQIESEKHRNNG